MAVFKMDPMEDPPCYFCGEDSTVGFNGEGHAVCEFCGADERIVLAWDEESKIDGLLSLVDEEE